LNDVVTDQSDTQSKKKVLFVCTANRLRSPTAEALYRHNKNLDVKSAGVDREATTVLTADLLEWADIIFVFERRHRNIIHKQFKELYEQKKIICLYVPDEYDHMDPGLVTLLKIRLERYIGLPENETLFGKERI
jgi:predicted protein tyrosine phosphatase